MLKLTIDLESRSRVDLKKCGMHRYAEDPSTQILCFAYKAHGKAPCLWIPPDIEAIFSANSPQSKADFQSAIDNADIIEAYNLGFEAALWREIMVKRYGFKPLPVMKLRCSAAKAAMYALPRALGQVCEALKLSQQKDKDGYRIMMRMCKPRTPTKKNLNEWWENKADFIKLCEYCRQDVISEEVLSESLPDMPASELAVWRLDQAINDRGIKADVEGAKELIARVKMKEGALLNEVFVLTEGAVGSARQIAATTAWLGARGINFESLNKVAVEEALSNAPMPDECKRLLEIRLMLGKSSVSKLDAIVSMACADNRVRGTMLYHGASTGRFAGKGIQPHNTPRDSYGEADVDRILALDADTVDMLYDDAFSVASRCVRGMLIADEGKELLAADFSSIEARVLAWLANEDKALEAFRSGRDIYRVNAESIFKTRYENVSKDQRQIGKVCIAEGQLVLTDVGLIPIESVTINMRVWDGVNFVSHAGIVCNGIKPVITYQGLTATPDHKVFVVGLRKPISLWRAAHEGRTLVTTEHGGKAIRASENNTKIDRHPKALDAIRIGKMRFMRAGKMDMLLQFKKWQNEWLPALFSTHKQTHLCSWKKIQRIEVTVRKQKRSRVQKLWRSWHKVSVRFAESVYSMGRKKLASRRLRWRRDRPDKQRWPLRAGEFAPFQSQRKQPKQAKHRLYALQRKAGFVRGCISFNTIFRSKSEVFPAYGLPAGSTGYDDRRYHASLSHLKKLQAKRVYDITNCGQRHRFTVSGKLVSNCELALGYQGFTNAFLTMAQTYGVHVPEDQAKEFCLAWRASRPNTVALWRGLEQAIIKTIRTKQPHACGRIKYGIRGPFLHCRLPSGRLLSYFNPHLVDEVSPYTGEMKTGVRYFGVDSVTKKWVRQSIYGGLATENVVQAIARDLLTDAMLRLEANGFPVVLHVHDEIVSECDIGADLGAFISLMRVAPDWAEGLPIDADGWKGRRYRK